MSEKVMHKIFLCAACMSIVALGLIVIFIFANGVPAIHKIGFFKFIAGTSWKPSSDEFGILPMIVGSCYVTGLSILMGVPVGVFCAVFLARFCPRGLYRILKPAIELMAGIPSIVYGFFGLVVIVPMIRNAFGGTGKSVLAASIMLAIMILPTIVSVSESAIRAVPESYYEGSLALGATRERSVFFVTLRAAKSGIMAGVILGIGRAVGETMAVAMVAGNQPIIPQSLISGVRTLTSNIVLEMAYATDLHMEALIATAAVLFVFILIINLSFSFIKRKSD